MRIAFFHELPPGGALRAVEAYGEYLSQNNKVDLYYVSERRVENDTFSEVYFHKFLPKIWKGKNWKVRLYKDTFEIYRLKKLHKSIAKKINSMNYDVVIVNASKYTQSPFILRYLTTFSAYYCHDPHLRIVYEKILDIDNDLPYSRKIYEKLNRLIRKKIDKTNIDNADLLIANSQFTKKGVKNSYNINSEVSYLGVEENVFKPLKIKKDIDVLFLGSTDKLDGYYELVHALNFLPKINTKILDFKKEWISDDRILRDYYNRSKIVLCLAYNEPFGLVPLEAMACGIPVIAVNEGGYIETIKHNQTGFLVKRNPKIIADKINFLLQNPELAVIMGKEGRKEIEKNWTWKISAESLFQKLNQHHNTNF